MNHGFAFTKSSHHEQRPTATGATPASVSWLGGSAARSVFAEPKEQEKKSDAERQADVVEYLKGRLQSGKGPATITEISDATEADLRKGKDEDVLDMIMANPKVESVNEDDPLQETAFVYVAKYAVTNQRELIQLINRCKGGICQEELVDTYKDVEADMAAMREDGRIISVLNKETNKINLYPRGDVFLTHLPGKVKIAAKSAVALTQEDMNGQIRRGEAVRLGKQWFRVSSEVVGLQTQRSKAPLSVTMDRDLSSSNVYKNEMGAPPESEEIDAAGGSGSSNVQHNTKVKAALRYPLPVSAVPADPTELHQVMFKKGLTTSKEGAPLKRPKRKAPDGSLKREQRAMKRALKRQQKARTYKTVTNTHLEGTELGKLLQGGQAGGGDRGGL